MALCCCKKSKHVTLNEAKDVQISLLNEKEENDHVTPNNTKPAPIVALQVTGALDLGKKCAIGVAQLPGSIYILCKDPSSVVVHRNESPFERTGEVKLDDLEDPWDLASSTKSSCLYITERRSNRVYKMTSPSHEVTRWLEDVGSPHTLAVTDPDDQVVVVRDGSPSGLVIYGPDAAQVQQILLPDVIGSPKHAVRSSAGNYLVSGRAKGIEVWGVFEVNVKGEILRRTSQLDVPFKHQMESYHLAVDSADRLIVADCWQYRVLIFDAELSQSEELPPKDSSRVCWPWRLHYVANDNQVLVLLHDGKVGRCAKDGGKDEVDEKTTKVEGDATAEEAKTKKDGEKETVKETEKEIEKEIEKHTEKQIEKETEKQTTEGKKREQDEEKEEKATSTDKKTENEGVQTAKVNEKEAAKPGEDIKKKEDENEEKNEQDKGKEETTRDDGHAVVYVYSYL